MLAHAWRKTVGQFPYESTADQHRPPQPAVIPTCASDGAPRRPARVGRERGRLRAERAVDTSGTIIGAGEVALAVERLGPDRVVFGSDLPHIDLAANVGKVLGAGLDPETEERVFGGTVARWLAEVAS